MANGLAGLQPFPQFAPGGKGGLIPSIQLPISRLGGVSPRGGGGGGRQKISPASYGLPYLLGAGLDQLDFLKPDIIEPQLTGDDYTDQILKEAESRYGPSYEAPSFLQSLLPVGVDILAAAALGERGGKEYGATAAARRDTKAKRDIGLAKEKRQYIKDKLEKEYGKLLMVDKDKAILGIEDYRPARFDPDRGVYQIPDPKNPKAGKDGYIDAPPNYIPWDPQSTRSAVDTLGDKDYKALQETSKELITLDMRTDSTIAAINTAIEGLSRGNNPLTATSALMSVGNSAYANLKQIAQYTGDGSVDKFFATMDDVNKGIGGSDGREGEGQLTKNIVKAVESGKKDAIKTAIDMWEATYADQTLPDGRSMSLAKVLGDTSYDKLDTASAMLQIGYLLASANGQTGRTLSDKDLMFHLQMIGYGATQDSNIARKLLLRVGNSLVNRTDRSAQTKMGPMSMMGYGPNLENKRYQAIIGRYWQPPIEDGNEIWTSPENYTPRTYGERTKYIKDSTNSNPYKTFNEYLIKYNPELMPGVGTGTEMIYNRESPQMDNTKGLYD